jgi:preprotein translocase subunit SecE
VATEAKVMDVKKQKSSRDLEYQGQGTSGIESRNVSTASVKKFKPREWIEGIKQEIKTIHWTSPEELRTYTKVVVGATFFFGMGVYFVDLFIHGALNFLTWMSRLLVG